MVQRLATFLLYPSPCDASPASACLQNSLALEGVVAGLVVSVPAGWVWLVGCLVEMSGRTVAGVVVVEQLDAGSLDYTTIPAVGTLSDQALA